jgi:hypothetical protein
MEEEQQQHDGSPPSEDSAAAPGPTTGPYGASSTSFSSCTNCEAFLEGHCNPSNQLLFHVCKLRTGTRREKEEAARHLGQFASESVRACIYQ